MGRTSVAKNIDEAFIYAVENPYSGNGLIKKTTAKYMTLNYDNEASGPFVVGEVVTGGTSAATGIIVALQDDGATGVLTLDHTSVAFEDDEEITGGTSAATADVNGVPSPHIVDVTRGAGDVFTVADGEVVVRAIRSVKGTTNAVITVARELAYDTQTGAWAVGETVTGAAGATGVVVADQDNGADGILTLDSVDQSVSAFVDGEVLTGSVVGAAKVAAGTTLNDRTATFSQGDQPDEAKQVTINGDALSTTILTGGAKGDSFEVLRGIPTYTSSDYLLYVRAKTSEEGDIATRIDDKGALQDWKPRSDIERTLSMTIDYINSKAGLAALADRDIIIIAERDDDRAGTVTEYDYFLQARINQESLPDESEGDEISTLVIPSRFERHYTISGT